MKKMILGMLVFSLFWVTNAAAQTKSRTLPILYSGNTLGQIEAIHG